MRVNWEAIGAIGEMLGAAGVIITLAYLAVQMRQSNRLAKRAAVQSLLAGRAEMNRFLASDPVLNDLVLKGTESPDELDEAEWRRFRTFVFTAIRHYEAIFLDNQDGLLPPGVWRSQQSSMERTFSMPGIQRLLRELESDFDEAFVRHVLLDQ